MRGIFPSLRFLCGVSILFVPHTSRATPAIVSELSSLVSRLISSVKKVEASPSDQTRSWGSFHDTDELLVISEFLLGMTRQAMSTTVDPSDPAVIELSKKCESLAAMLGIDASALSRDEKEGVQEIEDGDIDELGVFVRSLCGGLVCRIFSCLNVVKASLEVITEKVANLELSIADTLCCSLLSERMNDLSDQVVSCCNALSMDIEPIESLVESCCDELGNQIGGIKNRVVSCCDALSTDIEDIETEINACCILLSEQLQNDSCCSALSEQIDDVSTQVDSCCSALSTDIEPVDRAVESCCSALCDTVQNVLAVQDDSCCSVLTLKLDDLSTQVDSCCSALSVEIEPIEPAIESCCSALTDMLQSDSCCSVLSEKIDDVSEQVDSCCAVLSTEVETVDRAVESCCSALSAQLQDDSCGTVLNAKINDVSEQVDSCCDTVSTEINELDMKVGSCCSVLSDALPTDDSCCIILDEGLTGLSMEIESSCSAIAVQIDPLEPRVESCCSELSAQLVEGSCCSVLNDKLDDVSDQINSCFSVLEAGVAGCGCTVIRQADIDTPGGYKISTGGNYCLCESVSFVESAVDGITVSGADGIVIDLNGFVMDGMDLGEKGIHVTGGSYVTVKNGAIIQGASDGLRINNSDYFIVRDIRLDNNKEIALNIDQSSEGKVVNVQAVGNGKDGIETKLGAVRILIKDCNCDANKDFGFITNGTQNMVKGCGAMNNGKDGFGDKGSFSGGTNVGQKTNQFFNNYAGCNVADDYADIASNIIESSSNVNTDTGFWANVDLGCRRAT